MNVVIDEGNQGRGPDGPEDAPSPTLPPTSIDWSSLPMETRYTILSFLDKPAIKQFRLCSKFSRDTATSLLFDTLVLKKHRREAADAVFFVLDNGFSRFVNRIVLCASNFLIGAYKREISSVLYQDDLYGGVEHDPDIRLGTEPYRVHKRDIAPEIGYTNLLGVDDLDDEDRKYQSFLIWMFNQFKDLGKIRIEVRCDMDNEAILQCTRTYPRYLKLNPVPSMWVKAFLGRLCACLNWALKSMLKQRSCPEFEVEYRVRYLRMGSKFWFQCGMHLPLQTKEGKEAYEYESFDETSTKDEQHIIFQRIEVNEVGHPDEDMGTSPAPKSEEAWLEKE